MIVIAGIAVLVFMSAVMAAAWRHVTRSGNAGWIDVHWSYGTGLAGIACALIPVQGLDWPTTRQGLVAVLVAIWSLRLGTYIAFRVSTGAEDARYVALKQSWGERFNRNAFWFVQVQAPASAILCLAILVAARRPGTADLGPADLLGLCVLAAAIAGETLADRQMREFKRDPANRGKVADRGLWGWSRHPNYFFEWMGWLAYPIIAVDFSGAYPPGWLALAAPVLMHLLLTRLTGVPPLEEAMVRSKGQAYRDYQATTSSFFPLPRRKPRRRSAA